MTPLPWQPRTFPVIAHGEPPMRLVHGYVHRGLGLFHTGWAPDRTRTRWRLIHLTTGAHLVDEMVGDVPTVFPVAGAIAGLTDFESWSMPLGWQQVCPDLPEMVADVAATRPGVVFLPEVGAYLSRPRPDPDHARRFIEAREDFEARYGDREGWWTPEEMADHG